MFLFFVSCFYHIFFFSKIRLNLFLEEVNEEEMLIKRILVNKTKKVHSIRRATKTEDIFLNILIEKHLYRDDRKYTVLGRASRAF